MLDKHSEGIAEVRAAMLDQWVSVDDYTLIDAVAALVLPVAAKLHDADGGRAYLKINSQLMSIDAYAPLRIKRLQSIPEARYENR